MKLRSATWTDVADCETDLALVPVGSTEQHGPHAPLGTDVITAETIADAATERSDREIVRAPTIPIGVAEEHRQFPGTMWVSAETFRNYVHESIASLASHGLDRVVIVNGHGGNVAALREVGARLTRDGTAYAVPFTWFDAVGDHSSDMGHGGPLETALLAHLEPDLVREDRLEEARAGAADGWGEWVSHANLAYDSAEFTENGVVGDPGEGSADRGAELYDLATDALVRLVDAVAERDVSRPDQRG
ncbi:creatininase family protein [Natrarchaeobaculum sulfurireducens]|uniref:Creatinine amidohydrolase n=1 Tax=Natrarchaeobaculum sulfurireducens TaxID=2044521 RepID=A0A346PKY5_9EURY|nr:creatininase family protein [Natrarchaeobaculum sulfurireducens]AXR76503.1 Creatinine amidohydrolase/Fe(II)-dependent formamide hydrolase involved in riboflavin and F420 biosynthesis [Natrarchaeobaculum sulfurireducens]AXR80180.1 Creatinine amidohydrolase [Natrarchaeobaculum sulfurireducens]